MQQLTSHFNRKKAQFVSFFNSILQVIQKLSYDIQIQIDKEYHQSVIEFKDYEPNVVSNVCVKMEQNRVMVYHEMVDRLCGTLKNFANQLAAHKVGEIGLGNKVVNSLGSSQVQQNEVRKSIPKVVVSTEIETKPQRTIKQLVEANTSSEIIRFGQSRQHNRQLQRTPYNSNKLHNYQPNPMQIPSPFAQKLKLNQMKQTHSQHHQQSSSTQRSKQKIQILKKTDVCQSIDNYINKEAKQMLERSLSRQSSYGSMRKSLTKKYDTPERSNYYKQYESSHIEKRIEEKLVGGYGESNGKFQNVGGGYVQSNSSKKLVQNMVSPIQKYKLY